MNNLTTRRTDIAQRGSLKVHGEALIDVTMVTVSIEEGDYNRLPREARDVIRLCAQGMRWHPHTITFEIPDYLVRDLDNITKRLSE